MDNMDFCGYLFPGGVHVKKLGHLQACQDEPDWLGRLTAIRRQDLEPSRFLWIGYFTNKAVGTSGVCGFQPIVRGATLPLTI